MCSFFSKATFDEILLDKWRTAHIVPVFEIDSRTDPANYRRVSLTFVPYKVMETIIKEKLIKFWEVKLYFVKNSN